MKHLNVSILLSLIAIGSIIAQSPAGFNYQAVVRNSSGKVLANQSVGIRMTLIQGSAGGSTVYSETFSQTTNSFGLINLVIGSGSVSSGDFSTIDWSSGAYFIETAIDTNGGSNYSVLGTSQLMSVPFALYADSSGNGGGTDGEDGASAFQIWLDAGNSGSEADFLASLEGETGATGADGADGEDGSGLTPTIQAEIDANTAKVGITTDQANAILTNSADPDTDETNEIQDISLSGSNLSISDGSTVDLSGIDTDTNTQLSETEVDDFVANNGYLTSFTEVDADPTNENQTVSAGAGISVSQTDQDFEVTNVAPDQTVTLTDGGAGNITIAGTYPDFTIDVTSLDDDDADPTNENQTVSAGAGISVSQTDQDFEVTNDAPDQTVTLTDGGAGNVTIAGTYPDFTIDVAILDDADADPANENQTVSAGTGITVNQTDQDFEVSNDAPDQTVTLTDGGAGNVTIAGTYPDFTIDVVNLDDADADATNEIQNLSDVLTESNDAGGVVIANLADPTSEQDAATKAYVDLLQSTVTTMSDALDQLTLRIRILEDGLAELIGQGVNGRDLLEAGATVSDFINDGFTVQEMLDANITVKELVDTGKIAADFYGATYQGGLIFDVDLTDGTGKISFTSNQSNSSNWDNAVTLCSNATSDGYSDWYLPTLVELRLQYSNLHLNRLGSFPTASQIHYWSSTESGSTDAYYKAFTTSSEFIQTKAAFVNVRAVRSFGGEVEQLVIAGESFQDLLDDGFSYGQLYGVGATIDELENLNPGASINDLVSFVSASNLFANDPSAYSVDNLYAASESLSELLVISNPQVLNSLGATVLELNNAGASDQDLIDLSGITLSELVTGNVALQSLLDNNYTPFEIYNNDNSDLSNLYDLTYQGGIIFYLNTGDGSGLIVSPADLDNASTWSDAGILAAAYDDTSWRLPTLVEWGDIYNNIANNSFSGGDNYWSSTEEDATNAYYKRYNSGSEGFDLKTETYFVRAVRFF